MTFEQESIALSVQGVSKTFGGERALRELSLTVRAGEIHGIVGENGSGKSTLIKLLAGFHAPDSPSQITICGQSAELPLRPGEARSRGVAFVHQELGLMGDVSVMENLFIEDFATQNTWRISWPQQRARAAKVLSEFGLSLDPDERVAELRPTDRALLAVARAASQIRAQVARATEGAATSGLLVLDEPTVYLPTQDRQRLFDLMRSIARSGVAIIFVAHDIDEVLAVTDCVTVLRDGQVVGTVASQATSPEQLVGLILGARPFSASRQERRPVGRTEVGFCVEGLLGAAVKGISLEAATGDIVGLTGLPGSGFDDIPYLLFGEIRASAGTLKMGEVQAELPHISPTAAVGFGMALIPADRLRAGAVGSLSVQDNVSLQVLGRFRRFFLSRGAMFRNAAAVADTYDVRPRDPAAEYRSLSGGNQQKVLMAKWLQARPKLLLLHEPTQGVDVGAREEIFRLLRDAARDGCTIVVASTDHEQLSAICDRVLITRSGLVAHTIEGDDLRKERITELSYGSSDREGTPRWLH